MDVIDWIKESSHTVVFTGAGMSTESGIPDFRSAKDGIWKNKDPMALASIDALYDNREEFIDFYKARMNSLQACEPHGGYHILSKWERQGYLNHVITQNVDGFHRKAGTKHLSELHGTISRVHCQNCGESYPDHFFTEGKFECNKCGGMLRPSVVLFGEMLPEEAFTVASQESASAELFIVLGSSLQVSPANHLPIEAKSTGAKLVIVNMEPTELDHLADKVIHDRKIGDWLQSVDAAL